MKDALEDANDLYQEDEDENEKADVIQKAIKEEKPETDKEGPPRIIVVGPHIAPRPSGTITEAMTDRSNL